MWHFDSMSSGRGRGCGHTSRCTPCRNVQQNLQHTITTRGRQIGTLYWALSMALESLHGSDHPSVVEAPLQIATQEPGARQQVARLKEQIHTDAEEHILELNGHCQVCWDQYTSNARQPIALSCGHLLCAECLGNLAVLKCPKCRDSVRFIVRLYT